MKGVSENRRLQVRLTRDVYKAADQLAGRSGVSLSSVCPPACGGRAGHAANDGTGSARHRRPRHGTVATLPRQRAI